MTLARWISVTLVLWAVASGCRSVGHGTGVEPEKPSSLPVSRPSSPVSPTPAGKPEAAAATGTPGPRGGVVLATSSLKPEVTWGPQGLYRVFFDAGDGVSEVTLTLNRTGAAPQEVALDKGPGGRCWYFLGGEQPAPVSVRLAYRTPTGPVVAEGPAPAMRQALHGGLVHPTSSGGEVELLVGPDGGYRVWVWDGCGALRPVAGAVGRVLLRTFQSGKWAEIPEVADVNLEPVGDHLAGKGTPVKLPSYTAMVVAAMSTDPSETGQFAVRSP